VINLAYNWNYRPHLDQHQAVRLLHSPLPTPSVPTQSFRFMGLCILQSQYVFIFCCGIARLWSQGGRRGLGDRSPQRGPGWCPGGVWKAKTPEARYLQTVCSCKMLFYPVLLPSPSYISPHPPPPKKFISAWIPWPNTAGQGGHVDPWLCYCFIGSTVVKL